MSIIDNIPYWEVNGANFFSCGRIHKCYPPEYAAKHVACERFAKSEIENADFILQPRS